MSADTYKVPRSERPCETCGGEIVLVANGIEITQTSITDPTQQTLLLRVRVCAECLRRVVTTLERFGKIGSRLTIEDEDHLRAVAVEVVTAHPDQLFVTDVATRLGCARKAGFAVVRRLVAEGVLGPRGNRQRLRVMEGAGAVSTTGSAPIAENDDA